MRSGISPLGTKHQIFTTKLAPSRLSNSSPAREFFVGKERSGPERFPPSPPGFEHQGDRRISKAEKP